jgi:hypothetical protein
LRDSSLYLVWPTDKRLPYLKKEKLGEEKKEEEEEEEEDEEEVDVDVDADALAVAPIQKIRTETVESEDEVEEIEDCIEGTSKDTETETDIFELTGHKIQVRQATTKSKEEWKKGIFTTKEAELLCLLHLSTATLQRIYKDEKWNEVSDFLESLSVSKCYNDPTLLLDRECSKTRDFLKDIYMDRFITLLDIYTGSTKLKASKDRTDILSIMMSKTQDMTLLKQDYNDKIKEIQRIFSNVEKKLQLVNTSTQTKEEVSAILRNAMSRMNKLSLPPISS